MYLISHRRLAGKNQIIDSLRENQTRILHQFFEGILRFSIDRDEFGERTGYTVTYVNPAFEEYFQVRNLEVREIPEQLLFQILFRDEVDWQSLIDPVKRVRKDILVPHTGKWYRVSSIPVDNDQMIFFFENITSIKNTLKELNFSKHRYKLLLETIPDMFSLLTRMELTSIMYPNRTVALTCLPVKLLEARFLR